MCLGSLMLKDEKKKRIWTVVCEFQENKQKFRNFKRIVQN